MFHCWGKLKMKGEKEMSNRFQKGFETIQKYVTEEEAKRMVEHDSLADIAPDLRKMIIEFAYGDIYSREGLDAKSRALVVITAVVTQGASPQIETHIKRGLTGGLDPKEIVEALLQMVPYIGFPRVQNALTIAQKVFHERGLTVS